MVVSLLFSLLVGLCSRVSTWSVEVFLATVENGTVLEEMVSRVANVASPASWIGG